MRKMFLKLGNSFFLQCYVFGELIIFSFSDAGDSRLSEKPKRYVFLLLFGPSRSALIFFKGSEAYPAEP